MRRPGNEARSPWPLSTGGTGTSSGDHNRQVAVSNSDHYRQGTLKSVNECMCGDLQVQGVVADR